MLKISGNRRDVSLKKMNNNSSLAAIFTKETVSDWEDQPAPGKPKRILCGWRSEAFNLCCSKLDEISLTMAKTTTSMKAIHRMIDRDAINVETPLEINLVSVPRKLPIDAYNPVYLESLSTVEREHIKAREAIGLERMARELNEMTIRRGAVLGQGGRPTSMGDQGMSPIQGPSGGS